MNATAAHVAHDVNEFKIAGLTAVPGKLVNVPRVAESPVSFECKLSQIIQLQGADGKKAQAWLTLGEVVAVHIDKALIKDGVYQTALARPIVRAGRKGDYFEIRPDAMFEMMRPDLTVRCGEVACGRIAFSGTERAFAVMSGGSPGRSISLYFQCEVSPESRAFR